MLAGESNVVASSRSVTVNDPIGWLATGSVEELRQSVAEVMPELAGRRLVLNDRPVTSNPRYFQGSAVIDGTFVVKFAWSEAAARRIAHEGRLLRALANARLDLSVPVVVAAATTPTLLITRPGNRRSPQLGSGEQPHRRAPQRTGQRPGPVSALVGPHDKRKPNL